MGGRGGGYSSSGPLGKRGKPFSVDEAAKLTNPHFKSGREWRYNCQRCVFAYEMLRRGYNVEAKPRIFDGTDRLPYGDSTGGWKQVMTGMEQVNMPSRNTIAKMDAQMAQWGDGSRAIVRVTWKGSRSGHVFVAEQVNGQTHYIDPQVGTHIKIESYMSEAIKGRTQLLRMDKAQPTDLIDKCVSRRTTG